jgi:hypothetical protein
MRSESAPLEKLDALSLLNINVLDPFADEFRIQLAWMRQSPPDIADPAWSFSTRVRQMKALLSEGIRSGEIRVDSPNAEMLARGVIGVQWIPETSWAPGGRFGTRATPSSAGRGALGLTCRHRPDE